MVFLLTKKICTKCGNEGEFYKAKNGKYGLDSVCKLCVKIRNDKYRAMHPEITRKISRTYRKRHPDKIRASNKKYRTLNLEATKKWRESEEGKAYKKNWAAKNPEKRRGGHRKEREKLKSTPRGHLNLTVARLIRFSLSRRNKEGKAGRHWEALVGYTIDQLKRHLEKQFLPGMSWDNMGEWHIDHKIPIAAFNFEKPEDIDFKRCWALKNLQPLWGIDNMKKQAKIDNPFQPSLCIGYREE